MTTEERLLRLENAFTTLVELARNIDERLDSQDSRMSVFEANLSALSDIVAEVAKNQRRTDEQLNNLVASQQRTDEQLKNLAMNQRRTDEYLSSLTVNQRRTDEQLNNLAALVGKYISEGGQGRP